MLSRIVNLGKRSLTNDSANLSKDKEICGYMYIFYHLYSIIFSLMCVYNYKPLNFATISALYTVSTTPFTCQCQWTVLCTSYTLSSALTPSQRKAGLLVRSQESFCMAKYKWKISVHHNCLQNTINANMYIILYSILMYKQNQQHILIQ